MVIEKAKADETLEKAMEEEFTRHEQKAGVSYNHTPFAFVAKENDEIIGAVTGFTCFSEVYIDDLVVMENHRGKKVGTQLMRAVETHYKDCGFNNMNLCTSEFQAPKFYEKLGFQLEFVRKNRNNPKLNKYYYVKFFPENQ